MLRLPNGFLSGQISSVFFSAARHASGSFTSRLSSPRLANSSWKSWRLLKATIKYGCILYVVNNYIVDFFVCIGPSMEPTIQSHDVVITEHISQRFGSLRRGDLIVSRSPINPSSFICKRIVGLNGDLVYDENLHLVKVPRGHVWLEGDNARDSVDSRRYGPVAEGLIRSKLYLRLWPPSRFGRIVNFRRKSLPGEDLEELSSY